MESDGTVVKLCEKSEGKARSREQGRVEISRAPGMLQKENKIVTTVRRSRDASSLAVNPLTGYGFPKLFADPQISPTTANAKRCDGGRFQGMELERGTEGEEKRGRKL